MRFNPKDFIATAEGLVFAVVSDVVEDGKVLCFLRYVRSYRQWRKVHTAEANLLLQQAYPHYLCHSKKLDAKLHGVPVCNINEHFRPRHRLAQLMAQQPKDEVEDDCRRLCLLLQQQGVVLDDVGVTGSLLPAFHNPASDIDLVFYGRETFRQGRRAIKVLLRQGECQALSEQDWLESYRRRDCHLNLPEYVRHERRKFNKAMFNRRKVDLSMIVEKSHKPHGNMTKLGAVTIKARVIDDRLAFDYPAEFAIDHDEIDKIVCFTATYTGQARIGESVEVSGQLEQTMEGRKWLVVGSSREAKGEYIKVLHEI
ncbi:hypothetical protein [Methylomarinum vadi]|uniref:hypothetical protein n=1 Tax=Methylomarinum vadi TaxID=438855 RepID=UPI0004DEFC5C|nr:hypothetical protein [Methylomarinum vadi]